MKKFLITAFIAISITLTGCSVNPGNSKNTSNLKLQTQNPFIAMSPSKDKFFINSNEGWRATYEPIGMFNEKMILYKTNDGGKT